MATCSSLWRSAAMMAVAATTPAIMIALPVQKYVRPARSSDAARSAWIRATGTQARALGRASQSRCSATTLPSRVT